MCFYFDNRNVTSGEKLWTKESLKANPTHPIFPLPLMETHQGFTKMIVEIKKKVEDLKRSFPSISTILILVPALRCFCPFLTFLTITVT